MTLTCAALHGCHNILYDYRMEYTPHMLRKSKQWTLHPTAIVSLLLSAACQQIHLQQTRSSVKIAGSVKLTSSPYHILPLLNICYIINHAHVDSAKTFTFSIMMHMLEGFVFNVLWLENDLWKLLKGNTVKATALGFP